MIPMSTDIGDARGISASAAEARARVANSSRVTSPEV